MKITCQALTLSKQLQNRTRMAVKYPNHENRSCKMCKTNVFHYQTCKFVTLLLMLLLLKLPIVSSGFLVITVFNNLILLFLRAKLMPIHAYTSNRAFAILY